jgi:intracellular septation protein
MNTRNAKPQLHPLLKLALDLGPLVLFFAANARFHLFVATGVFMAAVLVALAVTYALTRHLPLMPVVTAIIVVVFGGLTLILQDELFIKLKPTIIYLLFAGVLLGGLAFGKPLLGMVFDSLFHLTEEGWRKLTLRWALFFIVLAAQSTDVWVAFKVFGVVPLNFAFAMLQYPLMNRYAAPQPAQPQGPAAQVERGNDG